MDTQPKVLVIDDEEPARYGVVRALSQQGYQVEEAADGLQALDKISSFQPDIVVSDINMPGMDGLSLLRRVNEDPEGPLVVLITAYGSEEKAVQALRLGAYNYISKPFELSELRVIVRNALDKQRLLRENRHYVKELQRTLAELKESQAALAQAEKMASLARLVAGVAHEINSPLGALRSNTATIGLAARKIEEWLEQQGDEVRSPLERPITVLRAAAAQSGDAAQRIHATVSEMRQFAQLDRAEFQSSDIHDCMESALKLLEHEFAGQVEVVKEYASLCEINCSPRQLNQLFMNLFLNAYEAMQEANRQGRLCLRTSHENDCVEVEVEDNGCGIPPGSLERIFEPGFTTKGVQVGTGLGLAICYQIVKAHHGRIEVDSRPGEGARFLVTLPVNAER